MKTVFFDIDTQIDFVYPAGGLYVPNGERIVPAVARLNRYAAEHGITVVSTTDAHAEDDPEFQAWPPHCVSGSWPQRKPAATLLEPRVVIQNRAGALPPLEGARQIILEKQTVDMFQTKTIRPLLEALEAERYVVYGVVTEICVRHAAEGLLSTGKPVVVVTDAIETLNRQESQRTLASLESAGAKLATAAEIAGA